MLAFLAATAILSGCAVTSGSVFSSVAAAETDDPDDGQSGALVSAPVSGDESDDGTTLEVITSPAGAAVSLNFRRVGRAPVEITDIEPDRYLLSVELDGYYPIERRIELREGERLVIELDLKPITGFLDVSVTPIDATLQANGSVLSDAFAELPIGSYTVRAQRFGYEPVTKEVAIRENDVTRLTIELAEAAFAVQQFRTDRSVFSPQNPGILGRVGVLYEVTAPGRGRLTVTAGDGRPVFEQPIGPFTTWKQQVGWDGRNAEGSPLPDGTYDIHLSLTGSDGREEVRQAPVRIDSSRVVRYRSIWGSQPGLLYAPSGPPLPSSQYQITAQTAGIITIVDDVVVSRFPTRLGIRAGLGARLELSGAVGFTAGASIQSRLSAGASLGWQSAPLRAGPGVATSAGARVSGMYTAPYADGAFAGPDTQGSHPGFAVTLPAELIIDSFRFTVAPEYRLSPAPVWYGSGSRPSNRWTSLGYLRAAATADLRNWTIGASALIRTGALAEGIRLVAPFNAALEAHWLVPETPVGLSFFVAAEIVSPSDFYAMSGVGVGLLF